MGPRNVPNITPSTYRRITLVTLASLVFIMVTGAAVRLTGSGLGCSTWPSCEPDSFTPRSASDGAGMVEFANRLVTGAVGLFTVAAVVGAHRRRPRRDDLFRWSLGLPVWVFANALVGAAVVWLHLSPKTVMVHFLLSLGAVWNALVLHHKAGEDVEPGTSPGAEVARRPLAVPSLRRGCDALLAVASVVVVTGTIVTGSGPHAGDDDANRLGFDLESVVRIHGIAVLVFLGLTLWLVRRARHGDAEPSVTRRLEWLVGVLVAQGTVGYAQYFSGVPAVLVGIHVLGAALVWIAVVSVRLGLSEPEAGATTSDPRAEAETHVDPTKRPVRLP